MEQLFTSHGQVKPTRLGSRRRSHVHHERCLYPHVTPQTSYQRGCRCDRCGNPKNRQPRPTCTYPGCDTPRAKYQRKWCAEHATQLAVTGGAPPSGGGLYITECFNVWCSNPVRTRRITGDLSELRVYCAECQRQLPTGHTCRSHHVTAEQIEKWITTEKLACPGCHRSFTDDVRPAIDHDHQCCDSKYSQCGECVRGLLCTRCNVRLAYIEDAMRDGTLNDLISYLRDQSE